MILSYLPTNDELNDKEILNKFKILLKNPSYHSLENNYTKEQQKRNLNFKSFKETMKHLNENQNLDVVNFCYFIDAKVKSCKHCSGTGESKHSKDFSEEVSGKVNFYYPEGESIDKDKYSIMDGNIVEIKNSDFLAVLEHQENRGAKNLQEYVKELNSTTFKFLTSSEIFFIGKNRANEFEEDVLCAHCKGKGFFYLNENPNEFIHLWVIDKDNGCCFGIDSSLIDKNEIEESVLLLKKSSLDLFNLFSDFKNNTNTYKLKKWNGIVNTDTRFFSSFNSFRSFLSDWQEPNALNEFINYSLVDNLLSFWVIHPNKGFSIQIKIDINLNDIDEQKLIDEYITTIIDRNKIVFSNIEK